MNEPHTIMEDEVLVAWNKRSARKPQQTPKVPSYVGEVIAVTSHIQTYAQNEIEKLLATALEEQRMQTEVKTGLNAFGVTMEEIAKARATERAKVLSEVDGWLVDEFTEEDEWICPKCGNTVGEGYYCRNDRSKPVKETRKWEDGWQEAKNVLRAELRAKLNQLKGTDATKR